MRNHKSSCCRYPDFERCLEEDIAPDTEKTFAGAIAEDDYDDNSGWHIEDFDLEYFDEDEDSTTPTGRKPYHQDRFFESPASVLRLIRQQQDKVADFFVNLDHDSKGSPLKQIEMIHAQIDKSRKNLDDLLLRLDIPREIASLRGQHRKQRLQR